MEFQSRSFVVHLVIYNVCLLINVCVHVCVCVAKFGVRLAFIVTYLLVARLWRRRT